MFAQHWGQIFGSLLALFALAGLGQTWAATGSPIVIYVEDGAGPYSRSEQGRPVGLSYDLVKAIFDEANIAVDFRLVPYARCMVEAKAGTGAGCFLTTKNSEILNDYAWHARPVVNQIMAIVVRADTSIGKVTLDDLRGKSVIAVNGYTYGEDFYRVRRELKFQNAVTDVSALHMLNAKRADYAILEERIMRFNLKTERSLNGLAEKFRIAGYLDKLDTYISFSKHQVGVDKIISDFDAAQARLEKSGALARILKRQ